MKLFLTSIIALSILVGACKKDNKNWNTTINGITSASSPQAIDLTGDGIKDIVMGAGGEEWHNTEMGVIAINGANGELLWKTSAKNQIVGSAVFIDINNDQTPDVIIGGRSAELQAINGKNGEKIWEFYTKKGSMSARNDGWYNFFNPQLVFDQNNDQLSDILICNGGDAVIPAGMKNRPPGKLLLIDSKTGKILAEDLMPDAQETYFSPVCLDNSNNPTIIYGSGGETRNGHLYRCKLSDIRKKNLKASIVLDSTSQKGYIAPPTLADFTNDGTLDILINTAEGSTKLFDGKTNALVWSITCDSAEVFSQAAIGFFIGSDNFLDVFVNYAKGVYPFYKFTEQWLINGKTGKVEKKYTDKRFTYASPLTVDLNQDGVDEVLINTVKDSLINGKEKPFYELSTFDFKNNKITFIGSRHNGACFASTPWLGDLDNDQQLDIIYSGSPAIVSEFPGSTTYQHPTLDLFIHRIKFPKISSKMVKWGNYMGPNSTSTYSLKK
jgi:outer membrane protein assembly factor BamB